MAMLRGMVATLERHHKVRILDSRYRAVRSPSGTSRTQLPIKGVSVLDTACAGA